MSFLPDATDFTDIAVRPRPDLKFPGSKPGTWVLCPKCHGHGRWNLQLEVYGPVPGDPSGKRQHFQGSCSQCWGWGWVDATSTDATCLHTFSEIAPDQPFRCSHTLRCTACGLKRSYSSDD